MDLRQEVIAMLQEHAALNLSATNTLRDVSKNEPGYLAEMAKAHQETAALFVTAANLLRPKPRRTGRLPEFL